MQDEFEIVKENLQNEINNVEEKNYLDIDVVAKHPNVALDNVAVDTYVDQSIIDNAAATAIDYIDPTTVKL